MRKILFFSFMLVVLVGCLPTSALSLRPPAGFFSGLWHGWMAPLSLILGLFSPNVRLYEVNNVGWWYDFGYYMAIISGFGGISLTRKKRK
jgi:hypothetical protein